MSIRSLLGLSSIPMLLIAACGGDDGGQVAGDNTPYTSDPNKTVVVGAASGPSGAQAGATNNSGCVTLPNGTCVEAKGCADGERRDVIVDSSGKVVDVVCYPASSDPPVIDSNGNVTLDKNQNNGVVSVGNIAGDVSAAGNNVTVYGDGPAASVIGGGVNATGNNFAMRGVTVKGNVEVTGNNAVLVLCVIEGNVHITGNNNVIADCDILGGLQIDDVNNTIVSNHIGGNIQLADSKNTVCDGNTQWLDKNSNKLFDAGEEGAPITCQAKTK